MSTLTAARAFVERYNMSVIPLRPDDKKPVVTKWKPYQERLPRPDELEEWFRGRANIGVVTGAISGIVVIDVDGPAGEASLVDLPVPATVEVRTPRGRHLWFRHPGRGVRSGVRVMPGIDVRADGGYVVAPPSVVNGTEYTFVHALKDTELAELPAWFWKIVETATRTETVEPIDEDFTVVEGARNDRLTSEAGYLRRRRGMTVEAIEAVLLVWNAQHCRPPLPDREVRQIAKSSGRWEPEDDGEDVKDPEAPEVHSWEIRYSSLHQWKGGKKGSWVEVLPFAPVPLAIYTDEEGEVRGFEIQFRFSDRDSTATIPAAFVYTGGAAELLVRSGGPSLSSEQVRVLIRFLTDVAAGKSNVPKLPMITRAEWKGATYSGPGTGPIAAWQTELAGYGGAAESTDESARAVWTRICERSMESSKSMIVLGMPMGSMLVRPLKLDNFALHITSESSSGKTESAEIAMSAFGDAQKPQGPLYRTWDVSDQAPIALFRQVGCMPVWFDETAVLGDDTRFSTIIFRLAQGVNRMRADAYGGLTEGSAARWDACLLSTGEARITITSALSGMQRRVLEIAAPLTSLDAHEYMHEHVRQAYGWPLRWFAAGVDLPWAATFHRDVMGELSKVARSQQVEISQASNIATCALGFALLCRLVGYPVLPRRRILSAATDVFLDTLEDAGETGSDIGERALIALKAAMQQHPDKFVGPEAQPLGERWGITFRDGVVAIPSESTLAMVLERFAGLPDTSPVLRRWKQSGHLVGAPARGHQGHRPYWVVGSGVIDARAYLIQIR